MKDSGIRITHLLDIALLNAIVESFLINDVNIADLLLRVLGNCGSPLILCYFKLLPTGSGDDLVILSLAALFSV